MLSLVDFTMISCDIVEDAVASRDAHGNSEVMAVLGDDAAGQEGQLQGRKSMHGVTRSILNKINVAISFGVFHSITPSHTVRNHLAYQKRDHGTLIF